MFCLGCLCLRLFMMLFICFVLFLVVAGLNCFNSVVLDLLDLLLLWVWIVI